MVVAIDLEQRLNGHAQVSCGLPETGTVLHQQSSGSMAQSVWRYSLVELRERDRVFECDLSDFTPSPLNSTKCRAIRPRERQRRI